nr:uncharacterized protein LOC113400132 [Vanessa tameamea]
MASTKDRTRKPKRLRVPAALASSRASAPAPQGQGVLIIPPGHPSSRTAPSRRLSLTMSETSTPSSSTVAELRPVTVIDHAMFTFSYHGNDEVTNSDTIFTCGRAVRVIRRSETGDDRS